MSREKVHFELLGDLKVDGPNGAERLSPKEIALVARLFRSPDLQMERAGLARLLWPTSSGATGRHSLSQAIYKIRQTLGRETLTGDSRRIGIGTATSDVQQFLFSIRVADWEGAALLYTGPWLSSFVLDGCLDFGHWVESERAHLRGAAEGVLEELVAGGHWRSALKLEATLTGEESNNSNIRTLLGQVERALAIEDRGALPMLRRTTHGRDSGRGSVSGDGQSFVGRKEELEWLERTLTEATGNAGAYAVLTGERGIGKSALAERFCRRRVIRGDVVLAARGNETEKNVPFGIVDQLLRALPDRLISLARERVWWAPISAVFPNEHERVEFGTPADPVGYRQLLEALRRLCCEIASKQRLLLFIDDVQHADSASLAFLVYLLARRDQLPISVLCVSASTSRESPNIDLSASDAKWLTVGPLSPTEIRRLVASRSVHPWSDDQIDNLSRRTGGNPLFIAYALEAGPENILSPESPNDLGAYLKPTLGRVSLEGRLFLATLAILGAAVPIEQLCEVAGVGGTAGAAAVRELREANLIQDVAAGISLRHGIVGDIVLAMISNVEARGIHGRVARISRSSQWVGTAVSAVSHDIAGDTKAAFDAAQRAAEACRVLNAREERLFFLKLAISNAPSAQAEANARLDLSEGLLATDQPQSALAAVKQLDQDDLPSKILVRARIVRLKASVALATRIEELDEIWAEAKSIAPTLWRAKLAELCSMIASHAHDLWADAILEESTDKLRTLANELEPTVQRRLLLNAILIDGVTHNSSEALRELHTVHVGKEGSPHQCRHLVAEGSLLISDGRLVEAEERLSSAIFLAERHGLYDQLFQIHNNIGVCLTDRGKYEEAGEQFRRALSYGEMEARPNFYSLAHDNLAILYFESESLEEARQLAMSIFSSGSSIGMRSPVNSLSIMGLCDLRFGRLGDARANLRELRLGYSRTSSIKADLSYMHLFRARMLTTDENPRGAIDYLESAAEGYRHRLAPARWRLSLEAFNLRDKLRLPATGLEVLVAELRDSGANPLTDMAHSLLRRRSVRA